MREPGGTKTGEQVRKVLLQTDYSLTVHTETLLYMAARSELVQQVIMPALSGNNIVICDRFTDSTLAYQGYGGGMDLNWIKFLNSKVTAGCFPDLTFLLDLSVEEAAARRGGEADRMEKKEHSYHRRVRHGYLDIACRNRDRIIIIDASKKPEQQSREIWNELSPRLKRFSS